MTDQRTKPESSRRNILGLYDGHNTNAALVCDGSLVAAVEEERFSRIKNHDSRFSNLSAPRASVLACLQGRHLKIDTVALALEEPHSLHRDAVNSFLSSVKSGGLSRLDCKEINGVPCSLFDLIQYPLGFQRARFNKISNTLLEIGINPAEIELVHIPHHLAHASSVYFTSATDHALIITLDGKGDNLCGSVCLGQGGEIRVLRRIDYLHSLGHFFSAITVACGYKAIRHEGKIAGLAAYGHVDTEVLEEFRRLFQVVNATIVGHLSDGLPLGPYPDTPYAGHVKKIQEIVGDRPIADVAATAQRFLEDVVFEFVKQNVREHAARNLLVAGGIFANVRLNQKLACLEGLSSYQVHPAMSDAGLGVGAALAAYHQVHPFKPAALRDVFLGPSYSDAEIEQVLLDVDAITVQRPENIERQVAHILADGEVVCRFTGRVEYGPRALGNRSILYRTNDPKANQWLNQRLNRTETMPFAPATLDEFMHECYTVIPSARSCDEFMTITYQCTDRMRNQSPGVVHLDGSARPQRVCASTNPSFYAVLREYYTLTGNPSLINTSFNLHEEPIVCSPQDALRAFLTARLGAMQMGNLLIKHKYPGH